MHQFILHENVSGNETSLCLCDLKVCLFLKFKFAELPDNNNSPVGD